MCGREPLGVGRLRLEALEGLGRGGHLEAQASHEDEVGVGAQGEEPVTVERAKGRASLRIEARLCERGFGIGEVALAEDVVGLQEIEAAVQRVAGGGRKRVVEAHATGQVTTALPWCQDGSQQTTRALASPTAPRRVIQVRNSTLPALSSSSPVRLAVSRPRPATRRSSIWWSHS